MALSTPELWSTLNLDNVTWQCLGAKVPRTKASSIVADFVQTCFERSAGRLVNLKIGLLGPENIPPIAATSHRWGKLWVHEQVMESLIDCDKFSGLASLQHLTFAGASPRQPITDHLHLPGLVSLHRRIDTSSLAITPRIQLAVPSLTHVHLGFQYPDISVAHLTSVLKTLPAITHLRVESHGGHFSEDSSTRRFPLVELHHLKRLSLRLSAWDVTHALLSHLNVPCLTHLRIEEFGYLPIEAVHHPISSVGDMLAGVPIDIESFSAQFVSGIERFLAIVATLRPSRIAFADRFYGPDANLSAFVREVVRGEDHVYQVQELAVFNSIGEVDDDVNPLFVASLVETIQHAAHDKPLKGPGASSKHTTLPGPTGVHERRRIDVHSEAPVDERTQGFLEDLSSLSVWEIRVHPHSPTRMRRYCRLADDYWSASTGAVDLNAKPRTLI